MSDRCDGRRDSRRLLWRFLPAIALAAMIALAAGPAVAGAVAAPTVEGTWEIPTDSTNAPAGCSGFGD